MSDPVFTGLRYSRVWEDHRLLSEALSVGPADRVLSIASAGDNALALALTGAEVTAVDINPVQLAWVELQYLARMNLNFGEYLRFVGDCEWGGALQDLSDVAAWRAEVYAQLRPRLSVGGRRYWDAEDEAIGSGPVRSGRLERYIGQFPGRLALADRADIDRLFNPSCRATERARLVDGLRLRGGVTAAMSVYFSNEALGGGGRDPSLYTQVDQADSGASFAERFLNALQQDRAPRNPYLRRFWTGITGDCDDPPPWSAPIAQADFEAAWNRITWLNEPLDEVLERLAGGAFTAVNASDIFEYFSPEDTARWFEHFARACANGARIAWWELLVNRPVPEGTSWRPLEVGGEGDRVFFYQRFRVAQRE